MFFSHNKPSWKQKKNRLFLYDGKSREPVAFITPLLNVPGWRYCYTVLKPCYTWQTIYDEPARSLTHAKRRAEKAALDYTLETCWDHDDSTCGHLHLEFPDKLQPRCWITVIRTPPQSFQLEISGINSKKDITINNLPSLQVACDLGNHVYQQLLRKALPYDDILAQWEL